MDVRGRSDHSDALVPLRKVMHSDDPAPSGTGSSAAHRDPITEVHRPDAARLEPLRKAYNDKALKPEDRAQLVHDYFHHTLRPGAAMPVILSLAGEGEMPLSKEGGIDGPLVAELRTSPRLQHAVRVAATELVKQKPIEESWPLLVQQLGVHDTLQSLALIYSFYKWQDAKGIPEDVMNAGGDAYGSSCWANQDRAGKILKGDKAAAEPSNLPQTLVMNHGSSFNYDAPTHFFAHAWLAYRLRELGFSEKQAVETSAMAGAYYESERPESLKENHGNDSIKDILMNAQGSNFGIELFRNAHTPLPGANDGIQAEDRTI